jgi:hypothetical protein
VFICNASGFEVFVPFAPDIDLLKSRRLDDVGDVRPNAPPPLGEEEGDDEEGDIRFPSPKPRFGRFAELRDALRPRVAKNPLEVGETTIEECLTAMEGEMGE